VSCLRRSCRSCRSQESGVRSQESGAPNGQAREDLRRNSPLGGTRCCREASHLAKAPSVRREELSQVPWKSGDRGQDKQWPCKSSYRLQILRHEPVCSNSEFCLLSLSHRSQLPVQAQEKTEKEEQSEPVNDGGVEDKDVELLAEIILFGTEKYIARF
jgi:hypothetical protein